MAQEASILAGLVPGAVWSARYRIVRRIAVGGMGAIFEVIDDKTHARRALKVMRESAAGDPDFRARFAVEAQITGPIESDHLVRIADAGVDEATGIPFLVMDLLHGEDLATLLEKRKSLPPGEALLYLSQTARGLDKTHAAGIVHRDLKPENLFVTQRPDGSRCVKVLDFGIAKLVASSREAKATRALGTPFYMSPEQMLGDGNIGPRADVYALGHIAYTLLVGEPYWYEESRSSASPTALVGKVMAGAKEPPSMRALRRCGALLPPEVDGWFARVTASRPEARFETASGAISALGVALGLVGNPAPPAEKPAHGSGLPRGGVGMTLPIAEGALPAGPRLPAPPPSAPARVSPPIDRTVAGDALAPSRDHAPAWMRPRPPPPPRRGRAALVIGLLVAGAFAGAALSFYLHGRNARAPDERTNLSAPP